MAIINSLLRGQLKGRIGNQWYAHARDAKGRPITRTGTINSNPTNPKTTAQMIRRAKFANSVKFYQRATANFFKFAFQDKRPNESDYNAFMRHNVDNSLILPKNLVESAGFPALGNRWNIVSGTLSRGNIAYGYQHLDSSFEFHINVAGTTIGEMSNNLIKTGAYNIDDIVTFVLISSSVTADTDLTTYSGQNPPLWTIYQFKINPADTTPIEDIEYIGAEGWTVSNSNSHLLFSFSSSERSFWLGFCVSRGVGSRLKVNTFSLFADNNAQKLVNSLLTESAQEDALKTWQASSSAILEGSVSDNSSASSNPTITKLIYNSKNYDLPATMPAISPDGSITIVLAGTGLASVTQDKFALTNGTISTFSVQNDGKRILMILKPSSTTESMVLTYGDTTICTVPVSTSVDVDG